MNINSIFVVHSNNCWLCDCAFPGQLRYRHSYYCRWHFWVSASDSHRGEGWSILATAVTAPWEDLPEPTLCPPAPPGPTPRHTMGRAWGKRGAGRWYELGLHSAGHQSYLNRPALRSLPAVPSTGHNHSFPFSSLSARPRLWNVEHFLSPSLFWRKLSRRFILAYFCFDCIVNILASL